MITVRYIFNSFFSMAVLLFSISTGDAATIQLPKTGQVSCYDASGNVIACQGTGQDGEYKTGVSSPNPRFTDNNNGTVTDNLTGLIWMKNANCQCPGTPPNGDLVWDTGLSWANCIRNGVCGLTDSSVEGDWRLPNVLELESLIDLSQGNVYRQAILPLGHPFINVVTDHNLYLTSSTLAGTPNHGWLINMTDGRIMDQYWSKGAGNGYAWAVR